MDSLNQLAINIEHITFKYPGNLNAIFAALNLKILIGERFGLFGPNGAGKTTLMNLMTGLLPYDLGSIQIFGQEIKNQNKSFNKIFGFVPQDFSFYQELS
ncbi:MAG: ATP-binding cassette domain-containing protein, partial [Chitinophagaceae bacterium]